MRVIVAGLGVQGHKRRRVAGGDVAPEDLLQIQNGSVVLKIRLAGGTTARLWEAQSCTFPSSESQAIVASGTYTIPLNTLTPVSSNPIPSTMQVCLASSDGVLNDSRPVDISSVANGAAAQGQSQQLARSGVGAPDGLLVTTRAGTTTWSNP